MDTPLPSITIIDIRRPSEFKGITFSGYLKNDARKALIQNIQGVMTAEACYWVAELLCSGHYNDLIEILVDYYVKNIHIANAKLVMYLENRISSFKTMLKDNYQHIELTARNDDTIRMIFHEMVVILSLAKKKQSISSSKLYDDEDFCLPILENKFMADSDEYANKIFREDDAEELFVPLNEFGYCIATNNTMQAIYWVDWMLEYNSICLKDGVVLTCEKRKFLNRYVEYKFQGDIVWLMWDLLVALTIKQENLKKLIYSALHLFMYDYRTTNCKKKKHILYFAIQLLTEKYDITQPIIPVKDKEQVEDFKAKMHIVYEEVKKSEESAGLQYLETVKEDNKNDNK